MKKQNDKSQNFSKKKVTKILKQYKDFLPKEKKATILICGKTGVGKTTTINTIFGKEVGKVGHFSRGTSKDDLYEWVSNEDANINIIDLPGLGDSDKKDSIFEEMYKRRIEEADAFIIIVAPPRPAESGTLKTLKLLLKCGIPAKHIMIGYNKLSSIKYPTQNNELKNIEMNGLIGPVNEEDKNIISKAKLALLADLQEELSDYGEFSIENIIEFDSISGWNMHELLTKAVKVLPWYSTLKFHKAVSKAADDVRKREEEKVKQEKKKLERLKSKLEIEKEQSTKEQARLKKKEKEINREKEKVEEDKERVREVGIVLKHKEDKLREVEAIINERARAIQAFVNNQRNLAQIIGENVLRGAAKAIEVVDEAAAAVVEGAIDVISDIGDEINKGIKKVSNWFRNLW